MKKTKHNRGARMIPRDVQPDIFVEALEYSPDVHRALIDRLDRLWDKKGLVGRAYAFDLFNHRMRKQSSRVSGPEFCAHGRRRAG